MTIHLLRAPATQEQIRDMLESHGSFIKVAVDIEHGVLAGGGEFHADCESVLVEDGSRRDVVWGADWVPAEQAVRYSALINIRGRANPSMQILDPAIQQQVERITRSIFARP